jgi:hypothetical protein
MRWDSNSAGQAGRRGHGRQVLKAAQQRTKSRPGVQHEHVVALNDLAGLGHAVQRLVAIDADHRQPELVAQVAVGQTHATSADSGGTCRT